MNLAAKIRKAGHDVRMFSEYHFRVDDQFDLFPNDRGRAIAWHDRYFNTRGRVPQDQAVHFVNNRLSEKRIESATKESFIQTITTTCGWSIEEAELEWKNRKEKAWQKNEGRETLNPAQ